MYHELIEPLGLPPALLAAAFRALLFHRERAAFSALFPAKGVS